MSAALRNVEIMTDQGPRIVTARKIGPFCVHEGFGEMQGWTVTHIVTGYALFRYLRDEATGLHLAEEVQELEVKWRLAKPEAIVRSATPEAKARIQQLKRQHEEFRLT